MRARVVSFILAPPTQWRAAGSAAAIAASRVKSLSPATTNGFHLPRHGSITLLSSSTPSEEEEAAAAVAAAADDIKQSSTGETSQHGQKRRRRTLLDDKLCDLGVNATLLQEAVQQSMADPTTGYDGNFGRAAIRTYRSFLYPKKPSSHHDEDDEAQLAAMAFRTAQQIDFLLKRHKSHQEEWVRHHDSTNTTSTSATSTSTIERKVFPVILLLDNLRSAFNVGSIFRTADATGCAHVVTTGITPHPHGNGAEKVAKSALGAEMVVPSRHFATTEKAIAFLREQHPQYKIMGLETTEKSRCYTDYSYPSEGVVIVLGNEVTGLDTKIMPLVDELVEIPMFGTKNSMNVASCAPIVLYEIVRQWNR